MPPRHHNHACSCPHTHAQPERPDPSSQAEAHRRHRHMHAGMLQLQTCQVTRPVQGTSSMKVPPQCRPIMPTSSSTPGRALTPRFAPAVLAMLGDAQAKQLLDMHRISCAECRPYRKREMKPGRVITTVVYRLSFRQIWQCDKPRQPVTHVLLLIGACQCRQQQSGLLQAVVARCLPTAVRATSGAPSKSSH